MLSLMVLTSMATYTLKKYVRMTVLKTNERELRRSWFVY